MNRAVRVHAYAHEQKSNVCCVGAAWYIVIEEGEGVYGPKGVRKSAGINTTEFQVATSSFASEHFHSVCFVRNLDYDTVQ